MKKVTPKDKAKEFEHYFGSEPKSEVRPFDLSGKDFWEQPNPHRGKEERMNEDK